MKNILLLTLIVSTLITFSQKTEHEKSYKALSKGTQSIKELNNLLVLYKDSSCFENVKDDIDNMAFYNLVLSKIYYKLGSFNDCIFYGDIALNNYKIVKDTFFIMSTLENLDSVYGIIDEDEISRDYFKRINKLAELSKDTMILAYNYVNMGLTYYSIDLEKALTFYEKAQKTLPEKYKNPQFDIYMSINKSYIYYNQNDYKNALIEDKKVLNLIEKKHYFNTSLMLNFAKIHKSIGQLDSALYYANLSLSLNNDRYNFNELTGSYFKNKDA